MSSEVSLHKLIRIVERAWKQESLKMARRHSRECYRFLKAHGYNGQHSLRNYDVLTPTMTARVR